MSQTGKDDDGGALEEQISFMRQEISKIGRFGTEDQIQTAGYEMIEIAKQNGTWTALDELKNITIPEDLQKFFRKQDRF